MFYILLITLNLQKLVYFVFVAAPTFTHSHLKLSCHVCVWLLCWKHSSIGCESWGCQEMKVQDWIKERLEFTFTKCKEWRKGWALLTGALGEIVRMLAEGNYPSHGGKYPQASLKLSISLNASPHALWWTPAFLSIRIVQSWTLRLDGSPIHLWQSPWA